MGFTSVIFLFFVMPVFFLIYYWVPNNKKNIFIFLVSFLILFWITPILSLVMLLISCLNFSLCFVMYKLYFLKDKRKYIFLMLILMNLVAFGILLFFKLNSLVYLQEELLSKIMISLFVCSNISYILDVYLKKGRLQRNFIDFLTYVFFFPKLFAGPLVKYRSIESQLKNRKVNFRNVSEGMQIFVIGLAQKCVLADSVNEAQQFVLSQTVNNISVSTAWLGVIVEFFYLYFYLRGYSNMARGLGRMMGFELPSNFRSILPSNSVTNFFERWNISILSWVRTYSQLFIKTSKFKMKIVLLFLGGLTYALFFGGGFSKCFVAVYFVVILALERLFIFDILVKLPQLVRRIYTFLLVLMGTVFFWQNSVEESLTYVRAMFGENGAFLDKSFIFFATSFAFILFLCWLFSTNILRDRMVGFKKKHKVTYYWMRYILNLVLFIISITFCITRLT